MWAGNDSIYQLRIQKAPFRDLIQSLSLLGQVFLITQTAAGKFKKLSFLMFYISFRLLNQDKKLE